VHKPVWKPSPNRAHREQAIKYIILHGTWMESTEDALERLCDEKAEVSCHYLIDERGELFQLVKDSEVAWHAGISAWGEDVSLNQTSLGIELSHDGDFTKPYTEKQYKTLVSLLEILLDAHNLQPTAVLAHSDIAPDRKNDPGPQFEWQKLYDKGVASPLCGEMNPTIDTLKKVGYVGSDEDILTAHHLRQGGLYQP